MPLPPYGCTPADPLCCTGLWDHAELLRVTAFDAVEACVPPDGCVYPDLASWVSHGFNTEDPVADFLVVSLVGFGPAPQSRDPYGALQVPALWRARFRVRLLETGWPMVGDNGEDIWVPDPEQIMQSSVHLYSHGEAMYRALADKVARKQIDDCGCKFHGIEDLTPLDPSGGAAGWETHVTVGVNMSGERHAS